MKYNIDYKVKFALVVILTLGTLVLFSFSLYEVYHETYTTSSVDRMKYEGEANIDYSVRLRPNMIYEVENIKDVPIIENYIDEINVDYSYVFKENLNIKPDIVGNLVISLEGYTGDKDNYKTIFKKEFQNIPLLADDFDKGLNGNVSIDYWSYKDFIREAFEEAKISVATKLNILLKLNIKYDNEFKALEYNIEPYIDIPISENIIVFNTANGVEKHQDEYVDSIEKRIDPRYTLIKWCIFIGIILLLILGFILVKTQGKNKPTKKMKLLNKIYKQNNSILIGTRNNIDTAGKETIWVNNFNDLVKISEEIRRPIYYLYNEDIYSINEFYLLSESIVYIYSILKPEAQYSNDTTT